MKNWVLSEVHGENLHTGERMIEKFGFLHLARFTREPDRHTKSTPGIQSETNCKISGISIALKNCHRDSVKWDRAIAVLAKDPGPGPG
jgi:hypothetical protein